MNDPAKPDRRVERTRQALLAAFRDLMFERGYDAFTVREIIDRANVGRSTFYEHYESKDDLFRESLAPVVAALANSTCTTDASDLQRLATLLAHFAENPAITSGVLSSSARRVMEAMLAEHIEPHLARRSRPHTSVAPVSDSIVAAHLAAGQLGMIEAWLSAKTQRGAGDVAAALLASTRASLDALLPLRGSAGG